MEIVIIENLTPKGTMELTSSLLPNKDIVIIIIHTSSINKEEEKKNLDYLFLGNLVSGWGWMKYISQFGYNCSFHSKEREKKKNFLLIHCKK